MPYSGSQGPYTDGEPTTMIDLKFGDISDANLSANVEGSTLYYDATTSKWKANSILHIDDVNNRVGINTITPGSALHVSGNALASGSVFVGSSDCRLQRESNGDLKIEKSNNANVLIGNTSSNTLVIDTANRRVGINRIPTEDLDISGNIRLNNNATGKIIFNDDNGGHKHAEIDALDDGTNGGQFKLKVKADGGSVGTALTIRQTGYVGIGTETPETLLHANVVGSATGEVDIARFSSVRASDGNLRFLDISSNNSGGYIAFDSSGSTSGSYIFRSGGAERVRIASGGNVGIGTDSPTNGFKLDVTGVTGTGIRIGDSSNSSSFRTQWTNDTATITAAKDGSDATRMNFFTQAVGGITSNTLHLYNSNVGVGTTNPLSKLDTRLALQTATPGPTANSYPIASFIGVDTGGGGNRGLEIGVPTGSVIDAPVYLKRSGTSARFCILNASDVEQFTILDGGNVGIGTKSPGQTLDVNGAVRSREGAFQLNNGTNTGGGLYFLKTILGSGTTSLAPALFAETGFAISFFTNGDVSISRMTISTTGTVSIPGTLSKGSGSFKIDHPLPAKTDTHHLVHSFIEGPQADLIYRGKIQLVNGTATVNIDTIAGMTEGTFTTLNRDIQCFTSNETDWDAVKGSVSGNILTIECQNASSTATISWMVIGERQDKHMYDTELTDENGKIIVEPLKNISS